MAHELEVHEDGTAAFFSARTPGWHRLGITTPDALTAEDAIKTAQLDWTVYKTEDPISAPVMTDEGITLVTHESRFLTYRKHPKTGEYDALGVVGSQYEPIQNADAFAFLNTLTDEAGAVFETAGSLNRGRKVFMSMKMPDSMMIGGQDKVDLYLLAWNTHDGTSAFNVIATPIRVVCQNTLTAGIHSAKSSWSIRHVSTATQQVQQARDTMGLTFKFAAEFQTAMDKMIEATMTEMEFSEFVDLIVPLTDDMTDRQAANVKDTRSQITAAWDLPTQDGIRGTRWAAYNSVTEWADWFKPVRGDDDDARASRILTDLAAAGTGNAPLNIKRKAYRVLSAAL